MIFDILGQAFVFVPFALGVFITYSILNRADLTVDGSFVLGAALFAKLVIFGVSPVLATIAATLVGALAGIGTALIQYKDRISSLIAGILALFILQSLNLMVMGRPNISLLNAPSLLNGSLPLLALTIVTLVITLTLFLRSKTGLMLRAFGSNAPLMRLLGKRAECYRILGFALSNALVAFSGVLTAQSHGFADIGMGMGLVLIGIGTVILGDQVVKGIGKGKNNALILQVTGVVMGTIIYFSVVNALVAFGLNPIFLKMLIGLVLIATLFFQTRRQKRREHIAV